MSREIKFRAWWQHPEYQPEGKMYRVGSLIMGTPEDGEPEYWFENTTPQEVGLIEMEGKSLKIGWNSAKECVLMQYTGLEDKNGKEIYEGDILSTEKGMVRVVEWKEAGFSFTWVAGTLGQEGDAAYEVIGNIYENPELLK